MSHIVIIGAGHAAIQCAASLRDLGDTSPITIISAESDLPYHRPPNSKKYIVEGVPEDFSLLRAADFYETEKIDLLLGETVESVDPAGRQVKFASGGGLGFEKLVMAPGSEPRTLPIPGIEHAPSLYSLQDARDIYSRLSGADTVAVIGGGFIGLEIAAAAAVSGKAVTVIEAAPQILGRSLTPNLAERIRSIHEEAGISIIDSVSVEKVTPDGVSTDGGFIGADLVLCGAGSVPRTQLAETADLEINNGIVVNQYLETRAANIYAIGDAACFLSVSGARRRYESVQNANDQARALAKTLSGELTAYSALPWFWSDQGTIKLQMAGDSGNASETVIVEGAQAPQVAAFCFDAQEHLCALETINWPAYHALSRKALSDGRVIGREALAAADFDLKAALKR
ncbi:MAG: FAD-dependent oxidoreductase [Proteobacteria bacterium]|nr:FAD-dependent oxidoreductase [Pseudomonadota bacterium]